MRTLLAEEVAELDSAMTNADLAKIADGVGDVIYVVLGIALQYGVDADRAVQAVHESNMTRELPSGVATTSDKVPRGDGYVPPDIDGVIGAAEQDG
jgi:predicted HAD superfamily Cof-like phosphohydrolase